MLFTFHYITPFYIPNAIKIRLTKISTTIINIINRGMASSLFPSLNSLITSTKTLKQIAK
ncbi:hypothetical protein BE24_0163 [Staphylococcus phage vB_SepM_BE24]|nr:hypothetical protein BE24_0163 [Staphylococcus phage vB_SepM_BE24]